MKKYEIYRAEREKGLTYQEIADKYDVTRQTVAYACNRRFPSHFHFWTAQNCVYPNVRKWLNDNKITKAELMRRLEIGIYPTNYSRICQYLNGSVYPQKLTIDRLLSVTNLTYEQFFETEQ